MKMLLQDFNKSEPDAIITTITSTVKDVQDAIYKVEETIDSYDSEDIENGLPDDCTIEWFDKDIHDFVWW